MLYVNYISIKLEKVRCIKKEKQRQFQIVANAVRLYVQYTIKKKGVQGLNVDRDYSMGSPSIIWLGYMFKNQWVCTAHHKILHIYFVF